MKTIVWRTFAKAPRFCENVIRDGKRRNMTDTYLVTGGAGFIGSTLVRHLIGNGHSVITLDALTYAGNLDNLAMVSDNSAHTFVHGSINDDALVRRLLAKHQPRYVINVAAETHVDRSIDGPAAFIETNVVGTGVLLEASYRYWTALDGAARDLFRYVQVSTDEVFGSIREGLFRESDPYRPNSPYAASKAGADHLAHSYFRTYGLPVMVTHGSNTYGPHQFPEKLIPLMILNALDGKPLPVYGDGSNVRDWLYVDDHAGGIATVAQRGQPGEAYNIGGGTERANLEVVNVLCNLLDAASPRAAPGSYADQITYVTDRPGHDFRYALDIAKISKQVDWTPEVTFGDGLANTVRWYLDNSDWCDAITRTRYSRERLGTGSDDMNSQRAGT